MEEETNTTREEQEFADSPVGQWQEVIKAQSRASTSAPCAGVHPERPSTQALCAYAQHERCFSFPFPFRARPERSGAKSKGALTFCHWSVRKQNRWRTMASTVLSIEFFVLQRFVRQTNPGIERRDAIAPQQEEIHRNKGHRHFKTDIRAALVFAER